jgi:hypothetical protein
VGGQKIVERLTSLDVGNGIPGNELSMLSSELAELSFGLFNLEEGVAEFAPVLALDLVFLLADCPLLVLGFAEGNFTGGKC